MLGFFWALIKKHQGTARRYAMIGFFSSLVFLISILCFVAGTFFEIGVMQRLSTVMMFLGSLGSLSMYLMLRASDKKNS